MPDQNDLNNVLGDAEEMTYREAEKLGAPELDPADLEGFLADTPAVWSGNEEKKGAPVAEELTLDAPDMSWQEKKPAAAVSQPVQPDPGVQDLLGDAPQVYDPVEEFCQKLQFDDNLKQTFLSLPADKQQQVVEMRAGQLGITAPPIPKEMRPKEETPAEEVLLEEAPKAEEYVPSFKDEDLERAKQEAKKPQRYSPPAQEMTEEQKKASLRMAAQLREEREKEQAHKGFLQLIILTIVGIVGAVAFAVFFGGLFGLTFENPDDLGWMSYVKSYAPLLAVAIGFASLLLAAPVPALKGLAKFLDVIGFIVSLFPGIPMLIQKGGNTAVNGVLLAAAAICFGVSVFMLTTSDSIHMYNKHGNS